MEVLKIKDAFGNWVGVPGIGPESLIPAPPTEDGAYVLSLDVEESTPVYSWVTPPGEGFAGPYDEDPEMDGTTSPGIAPEYARGDHVHPTDTSRASAADVTALQTAAEDKVLYLTSVACSATTGNFVSVSNAKITANHVLAECVFANPSAITADVTWTTASGSLTLNGTCSSATTCNIVLIKKDN